jgi:hypothetical protein
MMHGRKTFSLRYWMEISCIQIPKMRRTGKGKRVFVLKRKLPKMPS